MLAGHDKIQALIERHGLPPISLFIGPKSVGKRRLANQFAAKNTDHPNDVLRINRLTAELAREAVHFLQVAPTGSLLRVAIINVDDAPKANLNTLLKGLEEASQYSFVILLASAPPPETITSRARVVHHFSLLSNAEVEKALIVRGFRPNEAKIRAEESGGQVGGVLRHDDTSKLKSLVLIVVRCFRERDHAALEGLATRWTDEHTDLLVKLAHEAATGRWRVFNESEVGDLPKRLWLLILRALKPDVRPRLVIHAQLASVLRGLA